MVGVGIQALGLGGAMFAEVLYVRELGVQGSAPGNLVVDWFVLHPLYLDRNLDLVCGTSLRVNPPFMTELLAMLCNREVWRIILGSC